MDDNKGKMESGACGISNGVEATPIPFVPTQENLLGGSEDNICYGCIIRPTLLKSFTDVDTILLV